MSARRHLPRLTVTASAVGGTTPSITINFQTSPDNSTWTTQASLHGDHRNGSQTKTSARSERYTRLSWTVTGTTRPSRSSLLATWSNA